MARSPIFESHYRRYLEQIGRIEFDRLPETLGVERRAEAVIVPVFDKPYRVSTSGITDPHGKPAEYATGVILCRYLLECPQSRPTDDTWRAFRDFRDAAPLLDYFRANVEKRIGDHFCNRLPSLVAAAAALGVRRPALTLKYDFTGVFDPLPRVPVLLAFNDAEAMFPVHCSVLFETRVKFYLDMECVAMVGALLAERLIAASSGQKR